MKKTGFSLDILKIPEIMYGFGGGLAYKKFDASMHFSGVANRSTFLTAAGMYPSRWIPELQRF